MKIAYLNTYYGSEIPESENLIRYADVLKSQGHEFEFLTQKGYLVRDLSRHANDEGFDLVLCTDASVDELQVLTDTPMMFVDWCPYGYLGHLRMKEYISSLKHFDMAVTSCYNQEFELLKKHHMQNIVCSDKEHCVFPSLSDKCMIEPQARSDRKLVYIGINKDLGSSKGRYYDLLSYLDKTNLLHLYGPLNCWKEFKSDKGSIPFDGHSVLDKINEAGVCLALNSKFHNSVNFVTNRIFEGCVAGAAIIADDNPYTRENFGDNVFYIDIYKDETEEAKKVVNILEYINSHPDEVLEKIRNCQKIYREKFSIEKSLENMMYVYNQYKELKNNTNRTPVEVIAFVNKTEDLDSIRKNLQNQDYKNISVIVCAQNNCVDENAVQTYLGEFNPLLLSFDNKNMIDCFMSVKDKIRGEYFAFIDGETYWYHNFITKMISTLFNKKSNFVYAKSYNIKEHDIRNYVSINYDLLFRVLNSNNEDNAIDYAIMLEESYVLSSFLFNKKILEIIEDDILYFDRAPHIYLAIKSYTTNNDGGIYFNRTICGYNSVLNILDEYKKFYRCKCLLSTPIYLAFMEHIEASLIVKDIRKEEEYKNRCLKAIVMKYARKMMISYKLKNMLSPKSKYEARIRDLIKLKNYLKR